MALLTDSLFFLGHGALFVLFVPMAPKNKRDGMKQLKLKHLVSASENETIRKQHEDMLISFFFRYFISKQNNVYDRTHILRKQLSYRLEKKDDDVDTLLDSPTDEVIQ